MGGGRTRPGMPGLLHGRHSVQLRYRVPEGPPSLTRSEPNSLATGLNSVRHAGMRVCLYFFQRMEHQNAMAVNYDACLLQMVLAS